VSSVRTDLVFLSPPWGGPSYVQQKLLSFSQESIDGLEGVEIIKRALIMTNNVVCFLPRNTDFFDVLKKCKTTFKVCTLTLLKSQLFLHSLSGRFIDLTIATKPAQCTF
jgi:hypothetical protein